MDADESLALLLKLARRKEQELPSQGIRDAKALLEDLGHLALAVVHAGGFIGQSSHISIAEYRSMLQSQQQQTLEAYSRLPSAVKIDNYRQTVYTTWRVCYDQLGPQARELLWLVSSLNHSGITIDIFRRAASNVAAYTPELPTTSFEDFARERLWKFLRLFLGASQRWNSLAFTEAINQLASHSLLEYEHNNRAYRVHVLVQDWARTVIPDATEMAVECARALLSAAIPLDNSADSIKFRLSIGLHVDKALLDASAGIGANHARSFTKIYQDGGQWSKVELLQKQIQAKTEQELGPDHPYILSTMGTLVLAYLQTGQSEEARVLGIRVLESQKRVLGETNPDTLASMNNLILAYLYLGSSRLEEARALGVQVLDVRRRVLGINHPDTLTSMNNLGFIYSKLGHLEEARTLQSQLISQVLGATHPDTLIGIALTYSRLRQWNDAKSLQIQALEVWKELLGVNHPDTLTCMRNLAVTYSDLGQLEESKILHIHVLGVKKQIIGPDHPATLASMIDLAYIYLRLDIWEEAEKLGIDVDDFTRVFGENTIWVDGARKVVERIRLRSGKIACL